MCLFGHPDFITLLLTDFPCVLKQPVITFRMHALFSSQWRTALKLMCIVTVQAWCAQVQGDPACQDLTSWLAAEQQVWASGHLSPGKTDQLRALGVRLP